MYGARDVFDTRVMSMASHSLWVGIRQRWQTTMQSFTYLMSSSSVGEDNGSNVSTVDIDMGTHTRPVLG